MKMLLKAIPFDKEYIKFTVFIDGFDCGELCMRKKEAIFFHDMMELTSLKLKTDLDKIIVSGKWTTEKEEKDDK